MTKDPMHYREGEIDMAPEIEKLREENQKLRKKDPIQAIEKELQRAEKRNEELEKKIQRIKNNLVAYDAKHFALLAMLFLLIPVTVISLRVQFRGALRAMGIETLCTGAAILVSAGAVVFLIAAFFVAVGRAEN